MRKGYIKFAFLLPAVMWVLFFTIYPLVDSLRLSFFTYRLGMGVGEFVGFKNYLDLFKSPDFWNACRVMFIYVVVAVSIEMGLGLGFAWVFSREIKGKAFFRTVFTSPLFTTGVAVGYLGVTIFHETGGPVNYLLGFIGKQVPWLSSGSWAMVSIILLDVWRWTPFAFIILLAALQSVPEEMYEAASLDTSSELQIFRYISFPTILPAFTIALLLRLIEAFKQFGLIFSLTEGGPGRTTEIYCVLNYRTSIKYFDFGHGSAMAFLLLLVVMVIIIQFFGRMRKIYE